MILDLKSSDAPALLAPGRAAISYAELNERVEDVASALRAAGARPDDRVALVLPPGPELAIALLGASAAAVAVPLNPAFTAAEFGAVFERLRPRFLLAEPGGAAAARSSGLKVLEIAPDRRFGVRSPGAPRGPDETVLLILTSGTTARPKAVRLTGATLRAASKRFREALALGPDDRCLNLVPFFHAQGLKGALLPSLEAGGAVICAPGFHAPSFAGWLRDLGPTWFTAGPTLLRDILRAAPASHGLRFIRSVSAPLPPALLAELERAFGVPVLEGYGMTETGTITSNPLPPRARKPGTVGVAAGLEIAIRDGEVLVRGPSVTPGYFDDPEANVAAFADGWFRTGDLGRLDADGYLTLTGRVKELINRAGEKVSPFEVEEELLRHPEVAEAVVFPMPHARLGEDVAAAVVRRPGASVSEGGLRSFVAARLSVYKVPQRIAFVEEIPRGRSGKLARNGLAAALGVREEAPGRRPDFIAPEGETERRLAGIWRRLLKTEDVGAHDSFFDLGGDSLLAAELFAEMEEVFGKTLPLATLLGAPTPRSLAAAVDGGRPEWASLVPVQKGAAGRPPFFCVHGLGGNILDLQPLAREMGEDQPFFALQARGLDGREAPLERVEDMAGAYVKEILAERPEGPYFLGGWSFGGLVAFEMARQLRASGRTVGLLAILDSRRLLTAGAAPPDEAVFFDESFGKAPSGTPNDRLFRIRARFVHARQLRLSPFSPEYRARGRMEHAGWRAMLCYTARPYAGRVHLIWSTASLAGDPDRTIKAWERIAGEGVERFEIECGHLSVLQPPRHAEVARKLREWIDAARV